MRSGETCAFLGVANVVRAGQATVEYTLLAAIVFIPISVYLFPQLLRVIRNIFWTLAVDMTGPGI